MTTHTRRTFLLGLTLSGGAVVLAACGMGGTDHNAMNHGGNNNAPYDQNFIDGMVPHHQAAVEMAKVAQSKAEHAELKTLAGAIVADQDGEIAQMKGWRKAWYGSDQIAPGMGGHQMGGMDTDLTTLANAQPFDRAFIDAMLPHHESAVMMAKEAQTKAEHQELKELAGRIVVSQQREIDQMKAWRSQWYPG
ncbi:MAG TPA: DUF305 domain-containing protein [Thermomicrobiales bacterium]|jgi:uncharacterized protein (DUF305 family)